MPKGTDYKKAQQASKKLLASLRALSKDMKTNAGKLSTAENKIDIMLKKKKAKVARIKGSLKKERIKFDLKRLD